MLFLVKNSCSLNITLKPVSPGGELWVTTRCLGRWPGDWTLSWRQKKVPKADRCLKHSLPGTEHSKNILLLSFSTMGRIHHLLVYPTSSLDLRGFQIWKPRRRYGNKPLKSLWGGEHAVLASYLPGEMNFALAFSVFRSISGFHFTS